MHHWNLAADEVIAHLLTYLYLWLYLVDNSRINSLLTVTYGMNNNLCVLDK